MCVSDVCVCVCDVVWKKYRIILYDQLGSWSIEEIAKLELNIDALYHNVWEIKQNLDLGQWFLTF